MALAKPTCWTPFYYCCCTKSYFTALTARMYWRYQRFPGEGTVTSNNLPVKVVGILRETGRKEFLVNENYTKTGAAYCTFCLCDHCSRWCTDHYRWQWRKTPFPGCPVVPVESDYLQQLMDYNRSNATAQQPAEVGRWPACGRYTCWCVWWATGRILQITCSRCDGNSWIN